MVEKLAIEGIRDHRILSMDSRYAASWLTQVWLVLQCMGMHIVIVTEAQTLTIT